MFSILHSNSEPENETLSKPFVVGRKDNTSSDYIALDSAMATDNPNMGQNGAGEHMQTDSDQVIVNQQARMLYHQSDTPLDQRNVDSLWEFPNPAGQGKVVGKAHPIAKLFQKNCDLIARHWRISPEEVVPEEVRAQTPYSFALFLALRRLASHSKQSPKVGREALMQAWDHRVNGLAGTEYDGSLQVVETRVADFLFKSPSECEDVIQETNYGITLADARAANGLATANMKAQQAQERQPAGKLRGGDRKARAELQVARKERKAKNKASRDAVMESRGEDVQPSAAKISKKERKKQEKAGIMQKKMNGEAGYKLLQFLTSNDDEDGGVTLAEIEYGTVGDADSADGANVAPPNSPENTDAMYSNESARALRNAARTDRKAKIANEKVQDLAARDNLPPPMLKPKDGQAQNSGQEDDKIMRHDRHNANMLSQMFNRVDMDTDKVRRGKAKKVMASAAQHDTALPSQRLNLAAIPTLYTQREAEAATAAQLAGFGEMKLGGGSAGVNLDEDAEGGGVALGLANEDEEL